MRYKWPQFDLVADADAVRTVYPDGHWTGGSVVPQDAEHAALLGVSEIGHRLAHELAHHLVAEAMRTTSPIGGCDTLYRAAHGMVQDPEASWLHEWCVTAFTYAAFQKPMRHACDYQALERMHEAGVNLPAETARYRWLLAAPEHCTQVILGPR